MKNLLLIISITLFTSNLFSQNISMSDTPTEIKIKSSVVCGMCKKKIESELGVKSGIATVNVDILANIITVNYYEKVITKKDILTYISKLGYAADDIPADTEAYSKLPACCQINSGIKMQ